MPSPALPERAPVQAHAAKPQTAKPRTTQPDVGLLIAAHGERAAGMSNHTVHAIAGNVARRNIVAQVAVGFIKGDPTVGQAMASLVAPRIVVYPLFAANGYFTRDRLAALVDEASGDGRAVTTLPPLGLDPGFPDFVAGFARDAARRHALPAKDSTIVLLAHGSRRSPASREATTWMVKALREGNDFRAVEMAFLEETPFLPDTAAHARGPVIVVGMFSGEGLHGATDAPRLVADLSRNDVVYAGVVGASEALADVVARTVERAVRTL